MGTIVTIKGADFSKSGLGTVDNPNTGGGGSVDADVTAYFEIADTLTEQEKKAIILMVKALKDINVWSKLTGIYPFLGTGSDSRGANLKNTALNLSFVGYNASSENSKGWKGTSGMWAKTGLTGSWNTHYGAVYLSQKLGGSQVAFSVSNVSSAIISIISYPDGKMTTQIGNASTNRDFPANSGVGMFCLSTQSTSVDVYFNNTKTTGAKPTSSGTTELQLMGYNTGQMIGVSSIISIALFGEYLTESEVLSVNAIVDTFLSEIGRK